MDFRKKIEQSSFRNSLARQIKGARAHERGRDPFRYEFNRSGREAVLRLGGVEKLIEYVKKLNSKKILDIGVGTGKASNMIMNMQAAEGLDWHVTALRNDPELRERFEAGKIHITTAETLKGIENGSVAGVIALHSIMYATSPELTIKSIDAVLIPGGVLKATFNQTGKIEIYVQGNTAQDPKAFVDSLRFLGYDVAFRDHIFLGKTYKPGYRFIGPIKNAVLVAIKPGNAEAPKAEDLLIDDLKTLQEEYVDQGRKQKIFNLDDDETT